MEIDNLFLILGTSISRLLFSCFLHVSSTTLSILLPFSLEELRYLTIRECVVWGILKCWKKLLFMERGQITFGYYSFRAFYYSYVHFTCSFLLSVRIWVGKTHEGVRSRRFWARWARVLFCRVHYHSLCRPFSLSLSLSCQTLAESASRGISSWFSCGQDWIHQFDYPSSV